MKRGLTYIVLLIISSNIGLFAQIDSTFLYPSNKKDSGFHMGSADSTLVTDTVKQDSLEEEYLLIGLTDSSMFYNPSLEVRFDTAKKGKIKVEKDKRIDDVIDFLSTPSNDGNVYMDGYRVQLFFDQDKSRVEAEKKRFLNAYTDFEAYMEWDSPNHYLRVGNFYTRQQAILFANQVLESFPSATVIKTRIVLPDLE